MFLDGLYYFEFFVIIPLTLMCNFYFIFIFLDYLWFRDFKIYIQFFIEILFFLLYFLAHFLFATSCYFGILLLLFIILSFLFESLILVLQISVSLVVIWTGSIDLHCQNFIRFWFVLSLRFLVIVQLLLVIVFILPHFLIILCILCSSSFLGAAT